MELEYQELKEVHETKARHFRMGSMSQDDYYAWLRIMHYTHAEAMQEIRFQLDEKQVVGEFAPGVIVRIIRFRSGKVERRMGTIKTILTKGAIVELAAGGYATLEFTHLQKASDKEIEQMAFDRAAVQEAKDHYDFSALDAFKKSRGL